MESVVRPILPKCVFGVNTLDFLGHTISSAGISPTEEKVRAIREYPVPVSRKQLKRFIGMVNYYHRFIPMLSEHLQPLYDTESDGKSVRAPLVWSEECQRAFENTKSALAEVTLLMSEPLLRLIFNFIYLTIVG